MLLQAIISHTPTVFSSYPENPLTDCYQNAQGKFSGKSLSIKYFCLSDYVRCCNNLLYMTFKVIFFFIYIPFASSFFIFSSFMTRLSAFLSYSSSFFVLAISVTENAWVI